MHLYSHVCLCLCLRQNADVDNNKKLYQLWEPHFCDDHEPPFISFSRFFLCTHTHACGILKILFFMHILMILTKMKFLHKKQRHWKNLAASQYSRFTKPKAKAKSYEKFRKIASVPLG